MGFVKSVPKNRGKVAVMGLYKKSGIKRITAGIIALFTVISVLFLCAFIAHEVNHECEGEECSVCLTIVQCENILRNMESGVTLQASVPVLFGLVAAFYVGLSAFAFATPVSRKVRLNN